MKKAHVLRSAIVLVVIALIGFVGLVNMVERQCAAVASGDVQQQHDGKAAQANSPSVNVAPLVTQPSAHQDWVKEFWCKNSLSELGTAWFTLFLAIATGALWYVTYSLAHDAKTNSEDQADRMDRSIAQAARAADSLYSLAMLTKANADAAQELLQRQTRAYIAVNFGGGTYQDANLEFGAGISVENTGYTPARKVCIEIASDVLDQPPSNAYSFPAPNFRLENDAIIAPRNQFTISRTIQRRVTDGEVAAIIEGTRRRLYIWGTVTYEDIFGSSYFTNFAHSYIWYKDQEQGKLKWHAFLHTAHNDAN